jgi:hypothetical protein
MFVAYILKRKVHNKFFKNSISNETIINLSEYVLGISFLILSVGNHEGFFLFKMFFFSIILTFASQMGLLAADAQMKSVMGIYPQ